jgi:transcriptional antiterminator RfaH
MMSSPQAFDGLRWYVVQTKPKQESRADANLRRYGLPTFAPKLRSPRARGPEGRVSYVVAPLFPGYIFSRFDADRQLQNVRLTRGVQKVIGLGEHATPVDDDVIALIQARIGEDGLVQLAEPRRGDTVRVISGPFQSLEGVFEERLSGRDRVMILISTMASQTRVQLPGTAIWNTTTRYFVS